MMFVDGFLVFKLLIIFQLKHFIADYPLQTRYMLGKFKPGWDFLGPLSAHCAVHAWMTLLILGFCGVFAQLWWLVIFDFVCHFIMDRVKASPEMLGRFKALSSMEYMVLEIQSTRYKHNSDFVKKQKRGNTYFWYSLGFDQMMHHFTHYIIIMYILGEIK